MGDPLTGAELRRGAEDCIDQRRPDREALRTWIHQGADRIDALTRDVARLEQALEGGGSEAALMMLEDARLAADQTIERVRQMEANAQAVVDQARSAAEEQAHEIIAAAHHEAAEIVEQGRRAAATHVRRTEAGCQERLDRAVSQADRIDRECRRLVDRARALDETYRGRVADIRAEAAALLTMLDHLDRLPITQPSDDIDPDAAIDQLLAEIVELNESPRFLQPPAGPSAGDASQAG